MVRICDSLAGAMTPNVAKEVTFQYSLLILSEDLLWFDSRTFNHSWMWLSTVGVRRKQIGDSEVSGVQRFHSSCYSGMCVGLACVEHRNI